MMDSQYHDSWARELSAGKWIGDEAFFRAPLYPYFMGVIYSVTGNSPLAVQWIQMAMGLASCFLIYLIARRLLDEKTALLAYFISSFYGMFFYFENELLIVALIVFLNLLGILFLLKGMESRRFAHYFLCGLFLGLSAIARPNILFFIITIPLFLVIRKQHINNRRFLFNLAAGVLGVVLPILPVLIYNGVVGGDFVPIASQGGVNFYIGNNPYSDGRTAVVPGTRESWWGGYEDQINIAKKDLDNPNAKPSEISNYWFSRGFTFMTENPGKAAGLMLKKLHMFWNGYEIGNNRDIAFVTRHSTVFSFFTFKFWMILPLAFAGLVFIFQNKKNGALFLCFILSYMVSIIIFFVNARFRMPLVSLFIILASYSITQIVNGIKEGRGKWISRIHTKIAVLVFAAGCAVVFPINFGGDNLSQAYFHEALAYQDREDFSAAVEAFEKSIKEDPKNVKAMVNLGALYLNELKEYDRAEQTFRKVLTVTPGNLKALYNLGLTGKLAGKTADALSAFSEMIRMSRGRLNDRETRALSYYAALEVGRIYEEQKSYQRALSYYFRALELSPRDFKVMGSLGRIYILSEEYELAKKILEKALELNSEYEYARELLGKIDNK